MSNLPALREVASVRVVACPHPFREEQTKLVLAPGLSLGDILRRVQPEISRYDAHVWIGEDYIPRERWEFTYPPAGAWISIRVLPHGAVGRLIGTIFIAVAAIAAAFFVPPLFGLAAGTLAYMAVGAAAAMAVGLLGNLALNALFPPTMAPQRQAQLTGTGTQIGAASIQDSPTYSLNGGSNQANKFGPIPKILGIHKMFPLYGAETYTEIAGNDQFLRLLFIWGVSRVNGPGIQIESLKIGDTALENFTDMEIEHRNVRVKAPDGTLTDYGDEPLTLYTNDIHEEILTILLEQGIAQIRTTQVGAHECSVDITCPNGLYINDQYSGDRWSNHCDVKVELRLSNSSDLWVQVVSLNSDVYQQWVNSGLPWAPGQAVPAGYQPVFMTRQIDNGYSDPSGQAVSCYLLTHNTLPVSLRLIGGTSSAVRRSLRFVLPDGDGPYDIRVTRLTSPDTQFSSSQSYWTALRSINATSPWQPPVPCAVTVLRIKASNQLTGTVDKFSGLVSGIMPDWDPVTQTWITRITQNPASHYREMLQGPHSMDPYQDAELNLSKIQYFHEYCVTQGWKYNKIIDYDVNLEEILAEILAAGRAALDWLDSRRSLIIDEPQEYSLGPAFTPRNTNSFSSQITYPETVHCWRCAFRNELADYADDERLVLLDGYALLDAYGQKVDAWGQAAPDLPLATLFQQLPILGVTHPDLIFKHARYHGAQLKLRFEKHQFDAHLDQLVTRRGDRVKFAHDVILAGLAWGRVKDLLLEIVGGGYLADSQLGLTSGPGWFVPDEAGQGGWLDPFFVEEGEELPALTGSLSGVILDAPCPMTEGLSFAVRFRLANNITVLCPVQTVPGESKTLLFTDPIPPFDPGPPPSNYWPARGDLAMFGEAGKEAIDLVLYAVRPDSNLGAKLTAVEYNEDLYTADQGVIPAHDPHITIPPEWWTPVVAGVRSDGAVLYQESDGSWESRILIDLAIPGGLMPDIVGVEAQYWSDPPAKTLPVVPLGDWEISLRPVEDGKTYGFRLRYAKADGSRGPWSDVQAHTVVGKTAPPANVNGLKVLQSQGTVTVSWYPIADRDLAAYEVRYGPVGCTWENATVVNGQYLGTTFTTTDIPSGYSWDVLLKAIDTSGNYSQVATRKPLQVYQFYQVLSDQEHWPLWPGTLVNLGRNPRTGNLNPLDQDPASGDDFDLFDAYVVNPYGTMSYETPEIDLGEDKAARAWARMATDQGPAGSGGASPELLFDYRLDGGSYGGFLPWTAGYFTGRYAKFKVSFDSPLRLTAFEPVIDQSG